MNFYMPTKIITGTDCVKNSAGLIKQNYRKAVLVTGKSSAKKCGALDDVTAALEKACCEYVIYDKIEQNPKIESCIEGGNLAREFGADVIIGIGGGSPLDAAKAVAVFAADPKICEQNFYALDWQYDPLPVIAVGTTAGTGSEVTQVAVITNSNGLKKSIRHDKCFPVIALGDAKYTHSLSDEFTRSTAADALAHCIESYFNQTATDISALFAIRGAKIISDVFGKIKAGATVDAQMREQLYKASLYGGLAISVTGTNFPHSMGYFLSETYGIPHGSACAFYLPEFIEYNLKAAPKLSERFFKETGRSAKEFTELIKDVAPTVNVKLSSKQKNELKPRWQNNSCLKKCIGGITPEFLENMIEKLF